MRAWSKGTAICAAMSLSVMAEPSWATEAQAGGADATAIARPAIVQLYDPGLAEGIAPPRAERPYRYRPWYARPYYRPYGPGSWGRYASRPPNTDRHSYGRSPYAYARPYRPNGDGYRYGYAPRRYEGYVERYPGWRLEWRPYWAPDTRGDWRSAGRSYAGRY